MSKTVLWSSKIPSHSSFSLVACARLPLERGKKLRDVLREKYLLHQFFQHHHYDIGTKFPHAFPNGTRVATEPLLNTLDVSMGSNLLGGSVGCPSLCPGHGSNTNPLSQSLQLTSFTPSFILHPSSFTFILHAGGSEQRNVPQEIC